MAVRAGLIRRIAFHHEINLGVDLLAAGFYFFLAGRFSSNAFWIIILPLLTATFCFEEVAAFFQAPLWWGIIDRAIRVFSKRGQISKDSFQAG